ncbi:MAG: sugar ABC transporter substrate-binding protein, partial [Firmicutes bacterium]|nr:sugar ABC transporter substrate-binding protein [Bacillota bacterium]
SAATMAAVLWAGLALPAGEAWAQPSQSQAGKGAVKAELTYWPSANPQEIAFAKQVVAEWNARHPDTPVRMEPLPASRSTEEVLLAAVAAHTTPDVCSNINPGIVSALAATHSLYPLDRFQDFGSYVRSRTPEDIVARFRSADGHFYQLPWKGNPVMMVYNRRLFQEAGIRPEELATYAGFLAAAEKFRARFAPAGKWMIALNIDPVWWQRFFDFYPLYIAASGGKTLLQGGKPAFAGTAGTQVMQFLQTLFKRGYAPRSTFSGDAFLQEKVAVAITGPYALAFYEANKPAGFEYGVIPLPVPKAGARPVYTYADDKNIAIFSTCRHPEQAWEFVKFLTSKENDVRFLQTTWQIPFRRDLSRDPAFRQILQGRPQLGPFVRQSAYVAGTDDTQHLVEIFDAIAQEYQYGAVLGQETAAEAMENAAGRVNEILSSRF